MTHSGIGFLTVALVLLVGLGVKCQAETLEVGPGKPFKRIEQANARARSGDVILVHPLPGDRPYERVAVFVTKSRLTFRSLPATSGKRVRISGKKLEYSGVGSTPRAVFQFNRDADDCLLEGFEISGAHNDSHNGAGVRINQADNVTVRNCTIHHNDMGIMSNGDGTLEAARGQLIENCIIRDNGDRTRPGYNHNLYLGGTSVTLRGCEVAGSLTGHNVKSRAHLTRIEYCYIHHSANRELDLVDARETAFPNSHALLVGNVIVKDPKCSGNRAVIHFGQDGRREHNGTICLINNTIVTPFISPVVDLSTAGAGAYLANNIIYDARAGSRNQVLVSASRGGANLKNATGTHNWLSTGFTSLPAGFPPGTNRTHAGNLAFTNPAEHDYRLSRPYPAVVNAGLPWKDIDLPLTLRPDLDKTAPRPFSIDLQYKHPASTEKRTDAHRPDLGAYPHHPGQ